MVLSQGYVFDQIFLSQGHPTENRSRTPPSIFFRITPSPGPDRCHARRSVEQSSPWLRYEFSIDFSDPREEKINFRLSATMLRTLLHICKGQKVELQQYGWLPRTQNLTSVRKKQISSVGFIRHVTSNAEIKPERRKAKLSGPSLKDFLTQEGAAAQTTLDDSSVTSYIDSNLFAGLGRKGTSSILLSQWMHFNEFQKLSCISLALTSYNDRNPLLGDQGHVSISDKMVSS